MPTANNRFLWTSFFVLMLAASLLFGGRPAAAQEPRISEFMAVNEGPFTDEDGQYSDWIEIHNPSTNTVDLGGWYLTDSAGNLKKWQFPSTNMLPNSYLIVFASGKNRRVPGAPLHANFKLDAAGEYLALIKPDGVTVAFEYAPAYPHQVGRISYGIPVAQQTTVLVSSGAPARILVPTNDSVGQAWTSVGFDDSKWRAGTTGVGFETEGQGTFVPVTLGDSVTDFSGTQGSKNWHYGYWDKSGLEGISYSDAAFTPFPNAAGPHSENNYWNGTAWQWFNGNPPYTSLSASGGQPNANNGNSSRPDHWAIRRFVANTDGPVRVTGRLEHRGDWVYVTATGASSSSLLYIYFTAAGDGYVDDMKLVAGSVPEAGANLLAGGDFEAGSLASWTVSANLSGSALSTEVKHSGDSSLHVAASAGGSTQASAIWQTITPTLTSGATYTLSYWYRPGTNPAPFTVRFSNSWITATPDTCGDGVVGRVFLDGTQVFEKKALVSGSDYALDLQVKNGSHIDFAIDAGTMDNDLCDTATFTAKIETADPALMVVADSVADWSASGTQGENNWYYGYYNRTADSDHVYQAGDFISFPRDNGPNGPLNYWNGTGYDWYAGNPPWTEVGQNNIHPNGVNNSVEHWAIRRWVSTLSGRVTVNWTLAKSGSGGNGVTGRILLNGTQWDSAVIAGTDTTGVSRSVTLTNVHIGDYIDIALDPTGVGGATDDSVDGSTMTAVILGTPSLTAALATDIAAQMKDVNPSAYIRIPFSVAERPSAGFLTLRMKYDDGFVAFLNGTAVAARNAPIAPDPLLWNSSATATRRDVDAVVFQEIDLTPYLGLLQPGANVLAIQGLNISASDEDFLILPELVLNKLTADVSNHLFFAIPTPGGPNGLGSSNLGPVLVNVKHSPQEPKDDEDLAVTAEVIRTFHDVSSVTLTYRVMFGTEITVPMIDDGAHGDGLAGDGIFGGTIPASASTPGQMVRYFVYATDSNTNGTRFPAFLDALNSPQYQGTVVHNFALTNPLPVLHWFSQNQAAADSDAGTQGSFYFAGQFFDNGHVDVHGQSARSFPKKSYDIKLAAGDRLQWDPNEPAIDSINLLTTYGDKSYLRNKLGYESYTDAGCPSHFAFDVRVQLNGDFFCVSTFVENGDDTFLKRLGFDPQGALYKMYSSFTTAADATIGINTGAEKKTRKNEGNEDLLALLSGVSQSGQTLANYVYDNIDIPEAINMLAGHVLQNDEDCCHKNYYLYRDTEGNGEWQIFPWDVDLSFGHTWTADSNLYYYYDPRIYATNCYSQTTLDIGLNNRFVIALISPTAGVPAIRSMYLRRVRTITDQQLQPPDTHPYLLHFENKVNRLASELSPDANLDRAKWGTWAPSQTFAQSIDDLNINYFPLRRRWIYTTLSYTNGGPYMAPQPADVVIRIATIECNPASHNQGQEYIQLVNTNSFPVDISGWKLAGAVDYTFKGGVVLPTSGSLYVSPDVKAFRARTSGPRGGTGLFVQGNYQGQLSARGELLQLVDTTGRIVQATNYVSTPSPAQQYLRITEIMYHPSDTRPPGAYDVEDYEYLELKNTGAATMNLVGVHFTNGIDFAFTAASPMTSLAAGETVLLVKNRAAFQARYGAGPRIAGEYTGALDNGGEAIRLDDANNEKVLDFSYDNKWYRITDGFGFSLVIANENAPWDTWGLKESWRPSGLVGGSPGVTDPAPPAIPPVLVSELLSHSDPPQVDMIELYNPTTNLVNIGGWFISDDFTNAFKYRIPDDTTITAGGYRVFSENDFNPGGLGFAFSSSGDEAYLFSGNASTNLTGYYHGFKFGAAELGVTFGRYVTSLTQEVFVAQSASTLGTNNAGPKVGPVVISEIMYHPRDYADGSDDQDDEYIELRSLASTSLPLYDLAFPSNTWHLRGGVEFDFPSGATMAPNSRLLVLSFDPTNAAKLAAFRSLYSVPADVAVFGPYVGRLNNAGDSVKISKPGMPALDGSVPYPLVEQVEFTDGLPWPTGADGTGASLHRRNLALYADDPVNWVAAAPTPGADDLVATAPVITAQPTNLSVVAFSPATFHVGVTGTAPIHYQWLRNGAEVTGATNGDLTLTPQPLDDATFSVVVFDAGGAVTSSNASLSVLIPAYIITQPQSRTVFAMQSNVSFSVVAASPTPLRYQWRLNTSDIADATNSTYTIKAASPADEGLYTVLVTDDIGTIPSAAAQLTVLTHPLITTQPKSRTITLAGTATTASFTVSASSATPLRYQWYWNDAALPLANAATLTITNVQSTNAGAYTVVVSDNFGSVTSDPALLSIIVKPVFTLQPITQTNVVGSQVGLSAAWTGTPPLGHRWRRTYLGSTATLGFLTPTEGMVTMYVTNGYITSSPTSSVLVITNASLTTTGVYSIIASNVAGQTASANATLGVVADSDRDGLPDAWESAHPGFNSNDPADGARDDDGDGMSNAAEYAAGTDYLDPKSFLKVTIASNGSANISVLAVSNRTYSVQYKDALTGQPWRKLADILARTNSLPATVTDRNYITNRFYRLAIPSQP